jgi:hypothetical protein
MKYNAKKNNYHFYVVDTTSYRILSGWEFKSDAQDHTKEMGKAATYKVFTYAFLKNTAKLDPDSNANWEDIEPLEIDIFKDERSW